MSRNLKIQAALEEKQTSHFYRHPMKAAITENHIFPRLTRSGVEEKLFRKRCTNMMVVFTNLSVKLITVITLGPKRSMQMGLKLIILIIAPPVAQLAVIMVLDYQPCLPKG